MGAICNVMVSCDQTCKVLPQPAAQSGVIMLKLKGKLEFRGHVYFEAVCPQLVENALNWLMKNNALYSTINTDMGISVRILKTYKIMHQQITIQLHFVENPKQMRSTVVKRKVTIH